MSQNSPDISIVVPVRDEVAAITALIEEIDAAMNGRSFEVIVVNDDSQDGTAKVLQSLEPRYPWLRSLHHSRARGQSTAIRTGVRDARAPLIATLDGDGQNPPDQIPLLLAPLERDESGTIGLVQGQREARQDSQAKRLASRFANAIRGALLRDGVRDSGCGLKAFRRDVFLRLPYFDHVHRYLPALMIREGFKNQYLDVDHRHRETGQSKYTNWGRLRASVSDLLGVMWLKTRARQPGAISEF